MKRRAVRRCVFDDPAYINVKYIETKVYDSGHVENISCDRVYAINYDTEDDMLHTATKCSYISGNIADKITMNGHAIALYDRRIRNGRTSSSPDIHFHQVILIKQ